MPRKEYEASFTDSGIEIFKRYESIFDIPEDVRPVVAAKPLSAFPRDRSQRLKARKGRDGRTYWCVACESAVANKDKAFCLDCATKRNNESAHDYRARKAGRPTHVTLELDKMSRLVDLTDSVLDRIGEATIEFDRPHMTGGAIDELMLATKDLVQHLNAEIRGEVRRAMHAAEVVTPAEVRRRRAAAEQP